MATMDFQQLTKWTSLQLPFKIRVHSTIKLNVHEFIIFTGRRLYKYNSKIDKCEVWFRHALLYGNKISNIYNSTKTMSYDSKNEIIYIYDTNSNRLMTINCKHKSIQIQNNNFFNNTDNYSYLQMFYANNQLHFLGNQHNQHHIMYDLQSKKFNKIHTFSGFQPTFTGFCLVEIPLQNRMLLLGGNGSNEIYSYCTKNYKWTKLLITLPQPMTDFVSVLTIHQNHIIILGGEHTNDYKLSDKIYIIDLNEMIMKQSVIRCPVFRTSGSYRANISNHPIKEQLVTFGFVRDSWTKCNMNKNIFPPHYIIKLIQLWYCMEYLYLYQRKPFYGDNSKYWKISVDDIMNDTKDI